MKIRPFVVLFLLLGLYPRHEGFGQTPDATLIGQALEKASIPTAGIRILLTSEETGEIRRAESNARGEFAIPALAPGIYRLEAEGAGFRKYSRKGIALQVGQSQRLKILLERGGPAEEVVVEAEPVPARLDTASSGAVVENRPMMNFPLDGRDFLQLTLLLPGTAPAAQGSPGSVRGDFTVNANGAREDSNNFILDGVFNNDPKLNSYAVHPPADAIREFEVLTGTADATFGRSGGAQIHVALKSGSNAFHGTAYEFFRNAALDARNYFVRPDDPNPRYQRNQYGFSLGGPLRKNRTFFFTDYEGRRLREGITRLTNVPTAEERTGNFSQSIFSSPINPYTQKPFDNGIVPAAWISPTGKAIAALYPLPNRAVAGQNFVSSPALRDREDRFDARIDHTVSARSSLIGRYSFSDRSLYEPFSGPGFARVPGYGVEVARRAQNLMLGEDRIFSAGWMQQLRLSYTRIAFGSRQETRSGSLNRSVGLPELSSQPRDYGLSFITVSGYSPLGDEYNNPQHSTINVFQVSDLATHTAGRHLVRYGFDFRSLQQNAFRDIQSRGMLAFSDYGQVTGNGLADLLLGAITYSGGARLDNPQYLRTRSLNFFLQDSYRWRPHWTLLFGVRYEYNRPPVDRYDRANIFDPTSAALVPVGQGAVPRSGYRPDRNNWAPRIGLAWKPLRNRDLVLRAGYGIYYDQSSLAPGEGLYFNKPYYDFRMYFPLPGMPLTLADPFPSSYPFAIPGSALGFDRNLRTAYMQHWNLTLSLPLGEGRLLELAYLGSRGNKILSARDINQPKPAAIRPNPRPVPQFADITFEESRGISAFHSLQALFQQRFRAGWSSLLSYTFGRSLDSSSTFFSSSGDSNFPQDSSRPGAEYGRSNFDVRHRLSWGASYDLPMGRGHRLSPAGRIGEALAAGWSVHAILTLQSGRPFTVALLPELDNSNTGMSSLGFGANNRPNRISSGRLEQPGPGLWFDTRAFSPAPYGSFGNSGRNILDGPAYRDLSLSLLKDSRLREGKILQFRAEVFNLANHPNFHLPDIFFGSPSFGRISSAAAARRVQLGLKLLF